MHVPCTKNWGEGQGFFFLISKCLQSLKYNRDEGRTVSREGQSLWQLNFHHLIHEYYMQITYK